METLSKNIIMDLLPAYLSGEASPETCKLVEEFAKKDEEIARMIREENIPLEFVNNMPTPSEELGKRTLRQIHQSIRKQMFLIAMATTLILLIPLIAMQLTNEVKWDGMDFILMGSMLMGAGIAYIFISRFSRQSTFRAGLILAIFTGFVLIWVNLAVGLIGPENNPANLLYLVVLLIGIIGSFAVKFRAKGMKVVLFIMALFLFLVPFFALFLFRPLQDDLSGFIGEILVHSLFSSLFFISGYLFKKSES